MGYSIAVIFLCFVLLSTTFLSIFSSPSAEVLSSYECGFEPIGSNHLPFCMKFFLLAIIFIVFDVEVSFLVPSLYCSTLIFSFIILLLVGLLFEWSFGGLN